MVLVFVVVVVAVATEPDDFEVLVQKLVAWASAVRCWAVEALCSQFHQSFTHKFFVQMCVAQLFSSYILASNFFGTKILAQKSHIKWWWNWHLIFECWYSMTLFVRDSSKVRSLASSSSASSRNLQLWLYKRTFHNEKNVLRKKAHLTKLKRPSFKEIDSENTTISWKQK